MNPVISIVVPVYNVEQYVSICIESILDQTFDRLEVILIDDGSTDNSGRICDEYVDVDRRVKVVHQNNRGLSGARNRGILEARGEYITFIDSDDCVAPEFCEKLYGMLEKTKKDFCVCNYQKFQNDEEIGRTELKKEDCFSISNGEYLEKQLQSGFSAWAKMYRKEVFDRVEFYAGKIHEDIIFSADLAKNLQGGVCITEEKLYYYRQNDCGIMASSKKKCSADRVFAGKYLLDVVKERFPDLINQAFRYGIMFPWSYVDGIYVHKLFRENRKFLRKLQSVLKENRRLLKSEQLDLTAIEKKRLNLFSYSLILYGFNAYTRLLRVYIYHILKKDAYKDGHGI